MFLKLFSTKHPLIFFHFLEASKKKNKLVVRYFTLIWFVGDVRVSYMNFFFFIIFFYTLHYTLAPTQSKAERSDNVLSVTNEISRPIFEIFQLLSILCKN